MIAMDEKLDRIVETLQQVNVNLESLRVTLSSLVAVSDDHESRIRSTERWQQNLTPVLAVLTFLLGAIFTEVLDRLL